MGPAFVSLYAMRSAIRSYAVLTGSAWNTFYRRNHDVTWEHVVVMERSTYNTDQGLSQFFQFMIVFQFAQLCSKLMESSRYIKEIQDESVQEKYKKVLSLAALQGIYVYVIVGAAMA